MYVLPIIIDHYYLPNRTYCVGNEEVRCAPSMWIINDIDQESGKPKNVSSLLVSPDHSRNLNISMFENIKSFNYSSLKNDGFILFSSTFVFMTM